MAEKLVVERIRRADDIVEYRVRVSVSHVIGSDLDKKVPSEYVAAYVANMLREFVAGTTLEDDVMDRADTYRRSGTYTCPVCGREVDR